MAAGQEERLLWGEKRAPEVRERRTALPPNPISFRLRRLRPDAPISRIPTLLPAPLRSALRGDTRRQSRVRCFQRYGADGDALPPPPPPPPGVGPTLSSSQSLRRPDAG